ncbi:FAD dependent oxidoreductase [Clohesyomyces aquaticus]|uniref:FAD dependent oxidoreductase n=1 Tax=Clohesyomyces aquaticus TaxID=1231657 RepID=A0A1Y1ZXZ0_9PLEO|nr:FAD dependent oxidoreductase [Clohesyomyces aquaticus]
MSGLVIVLGAGVVGLQTAVSLLEDGHKVTIVTEHFPGDESIEYTSPWAGAIWRTHSAHDQKELCQWDIESYNHWMNTTTKGENMMTETGLERRSIRVYSAMPNIDTSSPSLWFSSHVSDFSIIPPTSLPPTCTSGYSYTSIAINPPIYLSHLLSKASTLGAQLIRASLPTSGGLPGAITAALHLARTPLSSSPILINCTGLSSSTLVPDPALYPIRGQTLLVSITPPPPPTSLHIVMHEDPAISPDVTYIIPRPLTSTFVFGGTKIPDDWSSEPDASTTKGILERCRNVWPEICDSKIEVLATQVGLRPGRKGGVRVEVEEVDVDVDGERRGKAKVKVVHQYGHAGAGYQLSLGSARKVLGIVRGIVEGRE